MGQRIYTEGPTGPREAGTDQTEPPPEIGMNPMGYRMDPPRSAAEVAATKSDWPTIQNGAEVIMARIVHRCIGMDIAQAGSSPAQVTHQTFCVVAE